MRTTTNPDQIPWSTLKYLIGEVMYGGRVIDDYDRRVVRTYMNEYLGDFIFDSFQPFYFYRNEFCSYSIPSNANSRDAFILEIDKLPLVNSPEVFGLHSNAEIGYYTKVVKNIWFNLVELQPHTGKLTAMISNLFSKILLKKL